MGLCREGERASVTVELRGQHPLWVSAQLQVTIGCEIILSIRLHNGLLKVTSSPTIDAGRSSGAHTRRDAPLRVALRGHLPRSNILGDDELFIDMLILEDRRRVVLHGNDRSSATALQDPHCCRRSFHAVFSGAGVNIRGIEGAAPDER